VWVTCSTGAVGTLVPAKDRDLKEGTRSGTSLFHLSGSKLLPAQGDPVAIGALDWEHIRERVTEICESEERDSGSSSEEQKVGEWASGCNDKVLERRALLTDSVEAFVPLHADVFNAKAKRDCDDQMTTFVQKHRNDAETESLRERIQPPQDVHMRISTDEVRP